MDESKKIPVVVNYDDDDDDDDDDLENVKVELKEKEPPEAETEDRPTEEHDAESISPENIIPPLPFDDNDFGLLDAIDADDTLSIDGGYIKEAYEDAEWHGQLGDLNTTHGSTASFGSIHLSRIDIGSYEEARLLAEEVILVLEEDLAKYFNITETGPGDGMIDPQFMREPLREKISGSSISIGSTISETCSKIPEEELCLYYERVHNEFGSYSLPNLKDGIDEEAQVLLHRSRRWKHHQKPAGVESGTQTQMIRMIPIEQERSVFLNMYPPEPEKEIRPSNVDVPMYEEEDIQEDKTPHSWFSFSNRQKILPPLKDNYYLEEMFWTGAKFRGEYRNRQFHLGEYVHPAGVKYVHDWKDGNFHTSKRYGMLEYPRGDKFVGQWFHGRHVSGEITFGDGLKYSTTNWKYCEEEDRRLRVERHHGIKAAGDSVFNDQSPNAKLPPGCYDVGDGIYNPKTKEIRGYDGFLLRFAPPLEHNWIIKHCRKALLPEEEYNPLFHEDRVPATYTEQIQRYTLQKRNKH